jgi:hypothetical protein
VLPLVGGAMSHNFGVPHGIRKYVEAETVGDSAKTTSLVAPTDGVTTPTLLEQQGTAASNFLNNLTTSHNSRPSRTAPDCPGIVPRSAPRFATVVTFCSRFKIVRVNLMRQPRFHSARSTVTGSTRIARRIGNQHVITAARITSPATLPSSHRFRVATPLSLPETPSEP